MNRVAYKLLEVGKDNSECSSATQSSRVSETKGEATSVSSGVTCIAADRLQESAGKVIIATKNGNIDLVLLRDNSSEMGSAHSDSSVAVNQPSSKSPVGGVFSYEEPLRKVRSSEASKSASSDLSSSEGLGTCSSPFTVIDPRDCTSDANTMPVNATDRDDRNKVGSVCYITATENLSQQALPGGDWFLTFEQFLSGLQYEPALCQFFAEQYMMDLLGSSVDPDLSSYTRSFMARKQ